MALLTDFPYKLGASAASGEQEHLLGAEVEFPFYDPDNSPPRMATWAMTIRARWVKNESGGVLTPGFIVKWDTGAVYGPGVAVGAAAVADTSIGIGVVDPWVTSIADNAHFFIIEYGPCKFRSTTGTATTIGATLALGAAGRVIVYAAPGSDTTTGNRDRCGTCREVVGSGVASDTLFDGFADFRH